MTKYQAPNVPFVEAYLIGSKQKPTAIAIELSMTTSEKGAALAIATRLHKPSSPSKSYHYISDEAGSYRGVWDNLAAHGNPYRALSVLVCAEPGDDVRLWGKPTHAPVRHRAAELVAELILAYKIKPRYLEGADLARWMKRKSRRNGGIIVHVPGVWPHETFLADVKAHLVMKSR